MKVGRQSDVTRVQAMRKHLGDGFLLMPQTAVEVGLKDPFDPLQAIPASARFLRKLQDQFGNLGLAAAAYNAGGGRIEKWLSRRASLPKETRDYVKIITGHKAEAWTDAENTVFMSVTFLTEVGFFILVGML